MKTHGRREEGRDFWGEIAPCDHLLQVYSDDEALLDALEGFAAGGLRREEGVIIVATEQHRRALEERLHRRSAMERVGLTTAIHEDRYIACDAGRTLARFMVDGRPDEGRFRREIGSLLARARGHRVPGAPRRVRAFGEMVAVLWSGGHAEATVELERLWHRICQQEGLALFCAYPEVGFTGVAAESAREIRELHSLLGG